MRVVFVVVAIAVAAMFAAGCANVSAPYVMKTDRVDQKLDGTGNRGYLQGTPPPVGDRGDLKRPWIAVDVDLPESSGERSAAVKETPAEVKREVTVVKEETPATVKTTTVVTKEEIK
jgi:hypothetical protein